MRQQDNLSNTKYKDLKNQHELMLQYAYLQKPNNLTEQQEQEWNTFKQVPGWSMYKVNAFGVLLGQKGHELKGQDNHYGYIYYVCTKDEDLEKHALSRHRAVALAWIPNPDNLPMVNHKDENKLNCYYQNLEWCTRSYNEMYNDKNKKSGKLKRQLYGKETFVYNLQGDFIDSFPSRIDCNV